MRLSVRSAGIVGLIFLPGLAALWFPSIAIAQGSHAEMGVKLSTEELLAGIAHGATLGAAVFLAGLVVFLTLVWLPSVSGDDPLPNASRSFSRLAWVLLVLLALSCLVELPLYAVRASGEPLSLGLLEEAVLGTRVGQLWTFRVALGLLTALCVASAFSSKTRAYYYWWGAAVVGAGALLSTLTLQSHAAAEGSALPLVSDWLHLVAAAVWMGGLLGFPVLLIGALRQMPAQRRTNLLWEMVRRFTKVAIVAVLIILVTGLYASLLNIPNLSALISTPYGQALIMKLGMVVLMLPIGAINLFDRGRDPFSRMVLAELVLALGVLVATGFLTTLAPADAEEPVAKVNQTSLIEYWR